MKGKLVKFFAIVLAFAAVCMMFINPVTNLVETVVLGNVISSTTTSYTFVQVLFGDDSIAGATYIFVAYMMINLGAIMLLVTGYFNLKNGVNFIATLVCALLILVGGISLFFTKDAFLAAQTNDIVIELFKNGVWSNTAAPIIGGILAIVSSLTAVVSIKFTK